MGCSRQDTKENSRPIEFSPDQPRLANFSDGEVWPASIRVAERLGYESESLRDSDSEYPGIEGLNKLFMAPCELSAGCRSQSRQRLGATRDNTPISGEIGYEGMNHPRESTPQSIFPDAR